LGIGNAQKSVYSATCPIRKDLELEAKMKF